MARLHHVHKARKDYPTEGIKKGQEYWWTKRRFRSKQRFAKKPRRSQLTGSDYLATIYDIQDGLSVTPAVEDAESITDELEELLETCESSLDNMPEQLKDTSYSGELLTERIDSLTSAIEQLQNVDESMGAEEIAEIVQNAVNGLE